MRKGKGTGGNGGVDGGGYGDGKKCWVLLQSEGCR